MSGGTSLLAQLWKYRGKGIISLDYIGILRPIEVHSDVLYKRRRRSWRRKEMVCREEAYTSFGVTKFMSYVLPGPQSQWEQ